jgi:hypothetical protein
MNSRHAAALALVGWYLMVPSKEHKPPYWNTIGESFERQKDCEKAAARIQQEAYGRSAVDTDPNQDVFKLWQLENIGCSDDPQLTRK